MRRVKPERLKELVKAYRKRHPRASIRLAGFCVLDELGENLSNEQYFVWMEQHGYKEAEIIKLNDERTDWR